MIEYSIEAAINSGVFQEVMVSTEDEEIAGIAVKNGAKVPFLRSEHASGDYATTAEALAEVLTEYQKGKRVFQRACCIYPTAPFITADKLREAMGLLEEEGTDAVIPVTAFSFPPMRGMYIKDGRLFYHHPEYAAKRSQDIETMYHDSGQFYCFKPEILLREKTLVTEHTRGIIVPESEVQDIDTIEDWAIAEIKYQRMLKKRNSGEKQNS